MMKINIVTFLTLCVMLLFLGVPKAYAQTDGTIRYNSSTNTLQIYSGTTWMNVHHGTGASCVPIVNGACGTSASGTGVYSQPTTGLCNAGTFTEVSDTATQFRWQCTGSGGGTNITCSRARAIDGGCGTSTAGSCATAQPTTNLCASGTFTEVADVAGWWRWYCAGINNGADSSTCQRDRCQPVAGVCGSSTAGSCVTSQPTTNLCSAGTFTEVSDVAGWWRWYCAGIETGADSPTCQRDRCQPVAGVCGSATAGSCVTSQPTSSLCAAGTFSDTSDTAGWWRWTCSGIEGGANSPTCERDRCQPVAGVCGSATAGSCVTSQPTSSLCAAGTFTEVSDVAGWWRWYCAGIETGANSPTCQRDRCQPVAGSCGSAASGACTFSQPTSSQCSAGNFSEVSDTGTQWRWNCNGIEGGANASCSRDVCIPVNGACGSASGSTPTASQPTSNRCSVGAYSDVADTGTHWQWSCNGEYGGSNDSCSNPKETYSWVTGAWGACSADATWSTSGWSACSANATWATGAWSGCSANATWSTSGWSACSANATWSTGGWSACSANATWSTGGWSGCSANATWSTSGWSACSANATWSTGSWGSCSASCGGGTQTRSVTCPSASGTQTRTVSCPSASGTQTRTVSCPSASGTQTRTVSCPTASGTRTRTVSCPSASGTQTRTVSCPEAFGSRTRSVTCPEVSGTQTRTVSCPTVSGSRSRSVTCRRGSDGAVVSDGLCTGTKPATSQSCSDSTCSGTAPASSRSCTDSTCSGTAPASSMSCSDTTCSGSAPASSQSCTDTTCSGAAPASSQSCTDTTCSGSAPSSSQSCTDTTCSGSAPASSQSCTDTTCSGGAPSSSQSCTDTTCSGGQPSTSQSCNTQACAVGCSFAQFGDCMVGAASHGQSSGSCLGTCNNGGTLEICDVPTGSCSYTCNNGSWVSNGNSCGCASCGGCFEEDTLISMADGSQKPIQDVKAGDKVLAFDKTAPYSPIVAREVAAAKFMGVKEIMEINGTIRVTPDHKFPTYEYGMREAGKLKFGDHLISADGRKTKVRSIVKNVGTADTYNMEVEEFHSYIANGYRTGNMLLLPESIEKYKSENVDDACFPSCKF